MAANLEIGNLDPMFYFKNVLHRKEHHIPRVLVDFAGQPELMEILSKWYDCEVIVEAKEISSELLSLPILAKRYSKEKDYKSIDYYYCPKEKENDWFPAALSGVIVVFTFDELKDLLEKTEMPSPIQRLNMFEWAKDLLT